MSAITASLPDGSDGRRVRLPGPAATTKSLRRATAPTSPPRDLERHLLLVRSGYAWRLLPHEFPPWQTAYHYFRLWRLDGTWEYLNTVLREQLRTNIGRNPQPSAGIIDSQSVRTTGVGGVRGYDGAKRVNGRKRHILVDSGAWYCAPRYTRPTFKIGPASRCSWRGLTINSPASSIYGSIRATQAAVRVGSKRTSGGE